MKPDVARSALLAALISSGAASPGRAETIEFNRIAGNWCGETTDYTFTRQKLTVTFQKDGTHRVLEVESIVPGDGWINFKWVGGGNTVFSEFSKDGNSMAQDANTTGDKGPRRPFRRC